MRFRQLLTVLIAVGLHVSLCTGGVFAMMTSVADQLAYSSTDSAPMSYGSIGYLSCESSERSEEEVGSVNVGGCSDAVSCLSQAGSVLAERAEAFLLSASDVLLPSTKHTAAAPPSFGKNPYKLARAGPLYEGLSSYTRSIQKLE